MNTRITSFWTPKVYVDPDSGASLTIYPDGQHQGSDINFLFALRTPQAERVAIAERVLAGVQKWRDGIVAKAEQDRGVADELAAARAEIERLKAEAGETP